MALSKLDHAKWHTSLIVLPGITGEIVENFVSLQAVAKETSVRGYKFHLEGYIRHVQGMSSERYLTVGLSCAVFFCFKMPVHVLKAVNRRL